MAEIGHDINHAKEVLESGGLVAIPTETVYGLAGNALDSAVVTNIFNAKKRPSFDPLIVHVSSLDQAKEFVLEVPKEAEALASRFWPGPLTILLKRKSSIPDIVTSGLDTVAIRVPAHGLTHQLLKSLDFPLAAPSANPFGYVSPTTASHVDQQLGHEVDYILDGGPCSVGIESTIVSFESEMPKVLRLGGLSVEDIEEVIGEVEVNIHSSSKPDAPGMLKSHYAPKTEIVISDDLNPEFRKGTKGMGALVFDEYFDGISLENQFVLSETGDMNEAASRLFTGLRTLDQRPDITTIVTKFVPNIGLGRAINDRIKRATAKE
ncbi:L-threonylcarbamoyladenylate synthase [Roseivirga sp. E12]|uniref:L-threonylcarbamoyladenylate synthase n=1 Tax=Roseivirga sp. E12 TaxID=2819237 RepID=UPI001ABD44B3|nr:L-threonylcarbamoyladenylate synthase [Roseivirga sp. E12]MBO3700185.1 threonylcarbamoyl-AMP synthase [Roseivirga sp. E12]